MNYLLFYTFHEGKGEAMRLNRRDGMGSLFLALIALIGFMPALASAATHGDYAMIGSLAKLPRPIRIDDSGLKLVADAKNWHREKDEDGTDLLNLKSSPETRVAAIRKTQGGAIEALVAYSLAKTKDKSEAGPESSSGLFFGAGGKLTAFTACEDEGAKSSVGRVCVTATPKLCEGLRKNEGLTIAILREAEIFEMRTLASLLTLRGSDHQLDNVVRFGNRLGLKSALQTTRGQLLALAAQIAKETGKAPASPPPATPELAEKAKKSNALTKNVLEKSLPRLKQACVDTRF